MADPEEEEEDEEEQVLSELEVDSGSYFCIMSLTCSLSSDSESDEGYVDEENQQPNIPGAKNSMLTVGYKGDRSYVVRGANIGVFGHDADNNVRYVGTMSHLATPKGKGFTPKQVRHIAIFTYPAFSFVGRSCFTSRTPNCSS